MQLTYFNKRKAESKFRLSKPKKRTVELGSSSDSDDNIDEKDIVQSDPEIVEDSDEETLMIKYRISSYSCCGNYSFLNS